MLARPAELGDPVGEHPHVDVLERAVGSEPRAEVAQVRRVRAPGRVGDPRRREESLGCRLEGHHSRFGAGYRIACR